MRALGPDDPRSLGTYRVLRVLGAGGMGRVYVGRSRTGRIVAIKVILPGLADDPGFRGRFRREVDAARRVGGAWTAPVLDADTEAERPWLVTGYVPGLSLGEAVAERGPLPEQSLHVLAAGLAEALTAVHQAGVVHRDLKPTNVMLSPDGPRVIDFGISRAVDASVLTSTGMTVGSPGFMAPEQIEGGDIGPATDVFALGAVLAYAATGEGPFGDGNSQALIFRVLTQEPRLDTVPESLRPVTAACLAKAPGDRPTPHDVLRAVLPGGDAAALVAAGWLPPDLANTVSRRAVALLELEDEAPAAGPPLGPYPPPPSSAGYDYREPSPGPPRAETTFVGREPAYGPFDAPTAGGVQTAARRPPWLYVVAAVIAVTAVITAVVLLRGDGDKGKGDSGSQSQSSTPGGAQADQVKPSPPPTASFKPGSLPEAYVGTWKGGIAIPGLEVSLVEQHVTIVLKQGASGTVVGTMLSTVAGIECRGETRLVGVEPTAILVEDVPGSGGRQNDACTDGGQSTLQLRSDGTLFFTALDDATGHPTGTLTKST
ncbi:serine/threonine-protein kinase [Streptodolium elevatio]|uniref:Serine/threonine-protein kinase n=1 Tax=Streptodolium elevatio TaxID=3157996 RepID=A0ABV3DSJ3_9ACTN